VIEFEDAGRGATGWGLDVRQNARRNIEQGVYQVQL